MEIRRPAPLSALLALLALLAAPARAQTIVNVERVPIEESDGLRLTLEGAARASAGNEDVTELRGSGLVGYRRGADWLRLFGGTRYLSREGEGLSSARSAHLRYNRIFSERWRSFHFVQMQESDAVLLERRVLVGSGVRAALVRGERHRLDAGVGVMLEAERLDRSRLPEGARAASRALRGSNLAVYRWRVRPGLELLDVLYYQPRLDEPADFRLLNETDLSVALVRPLSLLLRLEWRHDSRPPPGVERADVEFSTGLTLRLP